MALLLVFRNAYRWEHIDTVYLFSHHFNGAGMICAFDCCVFLLKTK